MEKKNRRKVNKSVSSHVKEGQTGSGHVLVLHSWKSSFPRTESCYPFQDSVFLPKAAGQIN